MMKSVSELVRASSAFSTPARSFLLWVSPEASHGYSRLSSSHFWRENFSTLAFSAPRFTITHTFQKMSCGYSKVSLRQVRRKAAFDLAASGYLACPEQGHILLLTDGSMSALSRLLTCGVLSRGYGTSTLNQWFHC